MSRSESRTIAGLVSIIIPNYNYINYLEGRFNSILNQTASNYEIVFLDDASTDHSVEFVREKYGHHIAVLDTNQKNSGSPFVQWNKGVHLSRGEYLWIAEADDTCAPNFLSRALAIMQQNPSIGLVYCHTLPMDNNGIILDENAYYSYVADLDSARWAGDFQNSGVDEVKNYLSRKNTIINVSGVLFRRNVYIKVGSAPEEMRMCGDWMFYCRLLRHADIAYISDPLNFHRQHAAKQTKNSVLDLTYFREFLQVQQYLLGEFTLSTIQRRAMFQRFLGEWDRLVFSNYGRIDVAGNLALARMTLASYSRIEERLVTFVHLVLNSLKSVFARWLKS